MNSGFWQIERQKEPLNNGRTIEEKIKVYQNLWEGRCYYDGIPDIVPRKVAASKRAPSWKAVAMAILRNDHHLSSLGFSSPKSMLVDDINAEEKQLASGQLCFEYSFVRTVCCSGSCSENPND